MYPRPRVFRADRASRRVPYRDGHEKAALPVRAGDIVARAFVPAPAPGPIHPAIAVLTDLDDAELHALTDVTYDAPQIAPGLLASIEGALEWPLQSADLDRPVMGRKLP